MDAEPSHDRPQPPPPPAYTIHTVQQTGADANRIDIIFLGDGYTAGQISTTYAADVGKLVDYLFTGGALTEPFGRFRNFFNVYRIDVVSNQAGADDPLNNITVDTALGATYMYDGVTDRLMSVDFTLANNVLTAALSGTSLRPDMRFVTVNASKYGGAGGYFATYAGGNSSALEVAVHEVGHSFANLADQYDYADGATYSGPDRPEPDVTTDPTGAKWAAWLGYNQPGVGVIGAYQGGYYNQFGIYRPSFDSKMRSLGHPFDAVGREQFVLDFYQYVHPIDSNTPNAAPLTDPLSLAVNVVDSAVIGVTWRVDGVAVTPTGGLFSVEPLRLAPGSHTISATAADATDWVRAPRVGMQQSVDWTVQVTRPLSPGAVTVAGGGGLRMVLPFDDTPRAAVAQTLLTAVNAAIDAGSVTAAVADNGTLPAATVGVAILHQSSLLALPAGYRTLIVHADAAATVFGGATGGQLVAAGMGGLLFNAGPGAGTVIAGGGDNLVSMYPGAGAQNVLLGAGNDTVVGLVGDDTIHAGGGSNAILLGLGHGDVLSEGADLIAGGPGGMRVVANANRPTIFLGGGANSVQGGAGGAVVVASAGTDTINLAPGAGAMVWLGTGDATVRLAAADTIVGGSGSASVAATGASALFFTGTGGTLFDNDSASATVVGAASGTLDIASGAGSLLGILQGATTFHGGTGAATLAAFGPALVADGGGGSVTFLGSPAGHNRLTAGAGVNIIVGGGDGDVLSAGASAASVIQAAGGASTVTAGASTGINNFFGATVPGAQTVLIGGSGTTSFLAGLGSETLIGGGGIDLFAFAAGRAVQATIQGFAAGTDYLSLTGFPTLEAANALAGASTVGGGLTLTLSDGTRILLAGLSSLAPGSIL